MLKDYLSYKKDHRLSHVWLVGFGSCGSWPVKSLKGSVKKGF